MATEAAVLSVDREERSMSPQTTPKEILDSSGRVVWYQYKNGDRVQCISVAFELDGRQYPAGTFLMKRTGEVYAAPMSPTEYAADRDARV